MPVDSFPDHGSAFQEKLIEGCQGIEQLQNHNYRGRMFSVIFPLLKERNLFDCSLPSIVISVSRSSYVKFSDMLQTAIIVSSFSSW